MLGMMPPHYPMDGQMSYPGQNYQKYSGKGDFNSSNFANT